MNLFLLGLLGAIWGTSFLFIKIIVHEIPPLTLVAGRTGFAALVLWGLIIMRKIPHPKDIKVWHAFAVVGIFNGALPYSLISWESSTYQVVGQHYSKLQHQYSPFFSHTFLQWMIV